MKTKKIINIFFLFCFTLTAAIAVSAANIGYWGGIVEIDNVQVNDSYTVGAYVDGTLVREDTLGSGPESPANYFLLVVEEDEGDGEDVEFRVRPSSETATCTLTQNEANQSWATGAHLLNLTYTSLANAGTCSCDFQCSSNNCDTNHCCPSGQVWCSGSCKSSCGGGGSGGGGGGGSSYWARYANQTNTSTDSTVNDSTSDSGDSGLGSDGSGSSSASDTDGSGASDGSGSGNQSVKVNDNKKSSDKDSDKKGLEGVTGKAISDDTGKANPWIGVLIIAVLGGIGLFVGLKFFRK